MAVKTNQKTLPANVALEITKQKDFVHKIKKIKEKYDYGIKPDRGIVYVSHIPHGFYETEMKSFFSQFGKVTRLRLSRSKKTGNSKGYAYVEFEDVDVAQIVADTMNNYLMFERLLKCQVLPSEKAHPALFNGAHRAFAKPKASQLSIERHNLVKSQFKLKKLKLKTEFKQKKKLAKLAALGVHIDLDSILTTSAKIGKAPVKTSVKTPVKTQKTPKTPMSKKADNTSQETPVQKIIPEKITTPEGELMVLVEDTDEEEITFKTPPNSIRSSKLTASGKRKKPTTDQTDTPRTSKVTSKLTDSTAEPPVQMELSLEPEVQNKPQSTKKLKTSKKEETPKSTKKPKKMAKKEDTPKSSEKPKRMATRSSMKKKLKTPPSSTRLRQKK